MEDTVNKELAQILERCQQRIKNGLTSLNEKRPVLPEDIVGPFFGRCKKHYDWAIKCQEPEKFERHMMKFSADERVFAAKIYGELIENGYTPFEVFDDRNKFTGRT